ncbi:hypothetical protein JXA85_05425 [Candidatus Woesearchaeota archaeon]|nr:hypothetical protein [Candidatus Woesearchaeota archaeon]
MPDNKQTITATNCYYLEDSLVENNQFKYWNAFFNTIELIPRKLEDNKISKKTSGEGEAYLAADTALYSIQRGEVFLYLLKGGENNPIFKNIYEATNAFHMFGNYSPTQDEAERIKKAEGAVRINLSKTRVKPFETPPGRYANLEFKINELEYVEGEDKKIVEYALGEEEQKKKIISNLKKLNYEKFDIRVWNPDYIKEIISEGDTIANLCATGHYKLGTANVKKQERYSLSFYTQIRIEFMHVW